MTGLDAVATGEPGALRLALTLGFAGLLSGLCIAFAYELTLPRIEANRAAALRAAVFQVVPGATAMQPLALVDGRLVPQDDLRGVEYLFAAYGAEGRFVGYAIPGEAVGFQDTIKLLLGFDPVRRRIVGMQVLESRETPGLGDKIYKDPAFATNFLDLAVEPAVVLVKKGAKRAPNEVDGITGATISSRAVVRILVTVIQRWLPLLPAPGSEPPLAAQGPGR